MLKQLTSLFTLPTRKNTEKPIKETSSENNAELVYKIPDSPLDIIHHPGGYFIGMGNVRMSEDFNTQKEALEHTTTFNFQITLIFEINRIHAEMKKSPTKDQPQIETADIQHE